MFLLSSLLLTGASLGGGAAVLKFLRLFDRLTGAEALACSFALGFGVLGWLIGISALGGMITTAFTVATCCILSVGLMVFLRDERFSPPRTRLRERLGKYEILILLGLGIALGYDILEGISPPADADSLAYHFAIPKMFLRAGGAVPVFRAADGTVPLLQHMTYMAALDLGGERGLTMWAMISGAAASAVIFAVALRHMDFRWALLSALLFVTVPAAIYGAGTGQVETRNAMFALVAAIFTIRARRSGGLGWAVAAGIACGFFVGSKYPGLIFAAVCGCWILSGRFGVRRAFAYAVAVLVAGGQWYGWNWWITGDPVFPVLYGILPYRDGVPWSDGINAAFKDLMAGERGVPSNIIWLFLYPLKATLDSLAVFESGRTGYGPLWLLLAPFAVMAWKIEPRASIRSTMGNLVLIGFAAYAIWFLIGPSQRARHFLPLYPLLLIPVMAATRRAILSFPSIRHPALFAVIAALAIQFSAHSVYAVNYARRLIDAETRDQFLARNVPGYEVVTWANKNLSPHDRLFFTQRQLNYFFEVPSFFANPPQQGVIEVHRHAKDKRLLLRQLADQGITHVLFPMAEINSGSGEILGRTLAALQARGCARPVKTFRLAFWTSRTLKHLGTHSETFVVMKIDRRAAGCADP